MFRRCALGLLQFSAALMGLVYASAAFGLGFSVVDIVPNNFSNETSQQAETNIAVNPLAVNPNDLGYLISSFDAPPAGGAAKIAGAGNNPYFGGSLDGLGWQLSTQEAHDDTTLDWTGSGTIYMSRLFGGGTDIAAHRSLPPNPPVVLVDKQHLSALFAGTDPDQPWVKGFVSGGNDRVYISHNDLGRGAAGARTSASVMFALDANAAGGGTWKTVGVERVAPAVQDGPAVRVAPDPNSNKVYVAFERYKGPGVLNANNKMAELIVVRDDNMGNGTGAGNEFMDLGANGSNALGFNVQREIPGLTGTALGQERLGSDLSIAVDPTTPGRLYVAYADVIKLADNSVVPRVRVMVSNSSGLGWSVERDLENNTALPALAVNASGTLGMLYTELKDGKLRTHMSTIGYNDFVNDFSGQRTNDVLASFTDGTPTAVGSPYIGDFQDLEARGNSFYGSFAAGNAPIVANFPQDALFLRSINDGSAVINGARIAANCTAAVCRLDDGTGAALPGNGGKTPNGVSIDPFFFASAPVPEPTGLLLVAFAFGTLGWCRNGRRSLQLSRSF